jgi:hypothetical protein
MSSGAVINVQPCEFLVKFKLESKAIGLNLRFAALLKSNPERFMSPLIPSVTPGIFPAMNVLDEKEFGKDEK